MMFKTTSRACGLWVAWVTAIVAIVAAFTLAMPQVAHADESKWQRLSGPTALDTMVKIVDEGWTTSDTVVIATQDSYWDALSASSIAGAKNAPIIMTDGETLSSQAEELIKELSPTKAYVVGGAASVSDTVKDAVEELIGEDSVTRLWGEDAIGTANAVAKETAEVQGSSASKTCVIATSRTFQDALSAAPYSYWTKSPVFLANADTRELDAETIKAIKDGGFENVLITGGTDSISENVVEQLASAGIDADNIVREGGATCYETSSAIANWCVEQGMKIDHMGVADGEGYWDALTGAALCGTKGSVIVLVTDTNRSAIDDAIVPGITSLSDGYIFGGIKSVSEATAAALDKAVDDNYFTVNIADGNGNIISKKVYSKADFQALASDSATPQSGMNYKGGTWSVKTATSYVTIDDLLADAGYSQYWGSGSLLQYQGKNTTPTQSYTYDQVTTGKFFPKVTKDSEDVSGATTVTPCLALSYGSATIESNAADAATAAAAKTSTDGAPMMLFGQSESAITTKTAAGMQYWTSLSSITIVKPYFTVNFVDIDGTTLLSKSYTKDEFEALKSDSATVQNGMHYKNGWTVKAATSYVTLEDLIADAGGSSYWKAGSLLQYQGKNTTPTQSFTYETVMGGQFFPNVTPDTADTTGATAVTPCLALSYGSASVTSTAAAASDTAAAATSTSGAPMMLFGQSASDVSSSQASGMQYWTGLSSITIVNAPYFTVNFVDVDGTALGSKSYTQAQFEALKSDSTAVQYGMNYKTSWSVKAATSYVTLEDLIADAGGADYWTTGSLLQYQGKGDTPTQSYTYAEVTGGQFFPNVTPDTADTSGATAVTPCLALSYGSASITSTAAAAGEEAAKATSTSGAPMMLFGQSASDVSSSKASGMRYWTGLTSITVVKAPYFTVNLQKADGTTESKQFTKAQFEALKSDSTTVQYGMNYKTSWSVKAATSYVTLSDLFAAAGYDSYWTEGSLLQYQGKGDTPTQSYTYAEVTGGQFFPNVTPDTADTTGATAVTPCLALSYGSASITSTAAAAGEEAAKATSTSGAPMMLFGQSASDVSSSKASGMRYWTGLTSITLVEEPDPQ